MSRRLPRVDTIEFGPLRVACYRDGRTAGEHRDTWQRVAVGQGRELICMADWARRPEAQLLTARFEAVVASCAERPTELPRRLLTDMNTALCQTREPTSLSMFAGLFDWQRGELTYANAGHSRPLFVPLGARDLHGGAEARPPCAPTELTLASKPLGIDPATAIGQESMTLAPGDKLVLFTDGLFEATSPRLKLWGMRAFRDAVTAHRDEDAPSLAEALIAAVRDYESEDLKADDATLVVIELTNACRLGTEKGEGRSAAT